MFSATHEISPLINLQGIVPQTYRSKAIRPMRLEPSNL